jgi:alpha-D-xyloside xylohydrolase
MGTKLVVSVWPTINENSENYWYMRDNNMLIRTTKGSNKVFDFYGPQAEIDATNPETRKFVFSKLKENYLDNGVDGVWFDEAEPEIHPEHFDNLIYHVGRGDEYGLIYPYYYSKMAYDGFTEMGETPVILTRAAYIGSQKFGSLVWSGDIYSDFESLSEQVKAGLNMSVCGIPWWNTDIGGFWGGDTQTDEFRELIVRWFQYGVFCPVMRVHGNRHRHGEKKRDVKEPSGDPNEIWSFGERNFEILKELVLLRERLRPYIEKHMKIASEKGYPVMRPMFFDFPEDEICYTLGEQYMFGDDILFAPIVNRGQTEKEVYLPEGKWVLTKTKEVYGGGWHKINAEINEFVAFVKEGADVINCF